MRYGIGEEGHLFALNPHKPSQMELQLKLNTIANIDIIKAALLKTIKIFDRLRFKPVINEIGELHFVENDNPLPIFKKDTKLRNVGSSDTNYYMYFISYDEHELLFVINHFISDGVGIGYFLNYFIYQYICIENNEYFDDELVKRLEDEKNTTKYDLISEKEKEYSIEHFKDKFDNFTLNFNNNNKDIYFFDKYIDTFESDIFYEGNIDYDVSEMKSVIKKLGISPLMFFTIIFNDSIIEVNDVKNQFISSGILVNLRSFLNSDSLSNFAAMAHLTYDTNWKKLPIEGKIECIKKAYGEALNYEDMVLTNGKIFDLLKQKQGVANINSLIEKRNTKVWRKIQDLDTYVISNVGNINFSEKFKEKVNSVSFHGPLMTVSPVVFLFSYKNKGTLIFAQNVLEDKILENTVNKMKEFGITAKLIVSEEKKYNYCDALGFEKV